LVPEDVSLYWDSAFDDVNDGRVALVPVDVMVYEGTTGEPLSGIELQFSSTVTGSAVLLPHDVEPLDGDPATEVDDGDGSLVWDAWRDRYFDLAFAEPQERMEVRTDDAGLARVYAMVDAFPSGSVGPAGSTGYLPIPFVVSRASAAADALNDGLSSDGFGDDTFSVVAR
jgi:hypothetical protein